MFSSDQTEGFVMSDQRNPINWRVLVDRFIWYDSKALALIPKEISNEEIQQYLNTFHTDEDGQNTRL